MESLVTTCRAGGPQIKRMNALLLLLPTRGALLVGGRVVQGGREPGQAIVDLNQLDSSHDWLPQDQVGQPPGKTPGIDDVPIVSLTLWSKQLGAPI